MEKESCADPDNTTTKRVISENTYDLIERNVVGRVGVIPTVSQSKKTTGRSAIIFVTIIATLALVLAVTILIIDKTSNQPAANTGSLDNTQTQLSASDESIQNQFFQTQLNNLTRAILPAIQAIQSNIDENHREIQDLHAHQSKKIQDLKNDTFRDIEAIRTQQDSTNHELRLLQNNTSRDIEAIRTQQDSTNREIQYLQSQHNDTDQKVVQANGNNSEDTQCLGFDHSHPAPSCQQIIDCSPSISSGHFWLGTEENVVLMFCDMNRTCGGVLGGWLRLIALDMRDENPPCPGNLMLIEESGKRLCTGNPDGSAFIEANVQYNMVCGRAIAYQYGALTSFYTTQHGIDNGYVNGISLTYSSNPRKHIWTFAGAYDEYGTTTRENCPCISGTSATQPPSFVGNDYFCDTGATRISSGSYTRTLYVGNPLWDGAGCGEGNTCCTFNTPPWFYKQLPETTGDSIELRVFDSSSYSSRGDNVYIEQIELYIR